MRMRITALILLVMLFAIPAAGQGMDAAQWSGPNQVLTGERITLRLTFSEGETVSGSLDFDDKQLNMIQVETAPGWDIRFSKRDFTMKREETSADGIWMEISFRVNNLPQGETIGVAANNLTLDGGNSLGDARWEMTVWSGLSGENHLTELQVENGKLSPEFQSDVLHYRVTVPADTKKPVVHAVPAPKAQVEIYAPYFTREGESAVTVTVTAEDGTQRVYTLLVLLEAEDAPDKPLLTEPSGTQGISADKMPSEIPEKGTPGWVIAAGILGGAALLGAGAILIERIVKKNR